MALQTQPTEACKAAGKPKKSTYKPKGKIIKLDDDLSVYEIGVGKKAIILLYDIFGWNEISKNVFEMADNFAKNGFFVLMPDFFRGEAWPIAEFPPQSDLQQQAFQAWKAGIASTVVMRKAVFENVLPHLYKSKIDTVGCIGFCWGGSQVFNLGQDSERFSAVASIHGAWIDDQKANALQVPLYYGPAKGDTEVAKVENVLKKKPFAKKCEYHAYLNQTHGFCAARGDWTDAKIKKDVDIVLKETTKFFLKNLAMK